MQRRNNNNNNSDRIQSVPLSGTVDPRVGDYKIPNANDWDDLRALRKAIMYEKYKQNQMESNNVKRYNDSNGKPNNYYHDPKEGDFNYEQYLLKQQKHNENQLNSNHSNNNNREPNRNNNNNANNDRQDYNAKFENRNNTSKDYSPFSGYSSIMELLNNQNSRTITNHGFSNNNNNNNNSNNMNNNDKSNPDKNQHVQQQLNQNYVNNNNNNSNRSNKMKDERNYPNILSWPETSRETATNKRVSTELTHGSKNDSKQNQHFSGNSTTLPNFGIPNNTNYNNENRNNFNYNNGDSRGQTSFSDFYPTNNNNSSNSSVGGERRNFSLDSIHAGDFITTKNNHYLPPYPDMKPRNTTTNTTTKNGNDNWQDKSSIPHEYLHNFINHGNISKSNYQDLLAALNLNKNNSMTNNNNVLMSKRDAVDDLNQQKQAPPQQQQRSFGLNKNPPNSNNNNNTTKNNNNSHNKGQLDYLLNSSHSMNSNPYPSTVTMSSKNLLVNNNNNQNLSSTLNFITNQRNGKLINNNSLKDVNNNYNNNILTGNSKNNIIINKSMKLDIPTTTKNPYFPQHLSETQASFRNPMDLHKKFRTSSTNQSTIDSTIKLTNNNNNNTKTNKMHYTQSAMNNIPIIPQVTESQASYQNPYAPRKLPMGYPDKNTNYFVRFSNSIRDSYNNDPSSRNCLLPPRPPESVTNRRNIQNSNNNNNTKTNKNNNEYVMLDYLSQSSDAMMMNRHSSSTNNAPSTNNIIIGQTNNNNNNDQYNVHKHDEMREQILRNHNNNDKMNNNYNFYNTTENYKKDFEMNNRQKNTGNGNHNQLSNSQYTLNVGKETLNRSPYSRINFNNNQNNNNNNHESSEKSKQNNPTTTNGSSNKNSMIHDKPKRQFPLPRLSKNNISRSNLQSTKVKKKTAKNTILKPSTSSFTRRCGDGDSRVTFASYSNDDDGERDEEEKLKYYGRPRVYSRARTTTMTTERNRLESRMNDMRRSSTVLTSNPYSRQDYDYYYDPGPTRSSRYDTPLLNTPLRERMSFRTGSRTATAKSRSTRAPTTISTSSSSHPNNPKQLKSILKQSQILFDRPMKIMLFCTKGIMTVPSPTDVIPNINSFSQPKDLISYNKNTMLPNSSDHRRHRFTVNMSGFLDEDIYFFTDKQRRKLVVEGRRPKRENINSRRLIETVDLPYGLDPDNLRIARDYKGHLLFEEAWIF